MSKSQDFGVLLTVGFSLFMSILVHICMYVLENVIYLCIFLYILGLHISDSGVFCFNFVFFILLVIHMCDFDS